MDFVRRLAGLFGRKKSENIAPNDLPSAAPDVQAVKSQPQPDAGGAVQRDRATPEAPKPRPVIGVVPPADDIVRQICAEARAARRNNYGDWDIENSPRYAALKSESPELQVAVAWAAYRGDQDRNSPYYWRSLEDGHGRRQIFAQALRKNLPFKPEQLQWLLRDWLDHELSSNRDYSGRALLGAVERWAKRHVLPPEMRRLLENILAFEREACQSARQDPETSSVFTRLGKLLHPDVKRERTLEVGPFAESLGRWTGTLNAEQRYAWQQLAFACVDVADKSKPSKKWLLTARELVDQIGSAKLTELLLELLCEIREERIAFWAADFIKGFVWISTLLDHSLLAGELGRLVEQYHSTWIGNAALWALSDMAGEPRAAAELFRLREKIKQHGTRQLIDRRIAELAEASDTIVSEMEDFSLPSFGLDQESQLRVAFGDAQVVLALAANGITQQWTNAAGKLVKTPPAEVREAFGKEFSAYRQQAKDIEAARQAQVMRIEQSWIEERSWAFCDWQENFLRHPLRRPIVESLIWEVGGRAGMVEAGQLIDISGNAQIFAASDRVRLWHPLDSDPQDVLAWRARLLARGVTQPIKQAHREIYVLTDAERATRTYSNRFAGHILRQHQFRAVCTSRGWRYSLMGDWDGWNIPTRALPRQNMTVDYNVEALDDGQRSEAAVALHLSSDQVRFLDAQGEPTTLENIAPIVFSEVMRDVDLFVAVTSIANDPHWTDGGPAGPHRGYWAEWAFGALGQSAGTRKELVTWILPKLSIADRLEIADKFLIVQGKRQKYAIHFGSGNIQILPSNRYLCIVPKAEPRETRGIKLPFFGDSLFSVILAKAFLLVDEDKIEDETILRQL